VLLHHAKYIFILAVGIRDLPRCFQIIQAGTFLVFRQPCCAIIGWCGGWGWSSFCGLTPKLGILYLARGETRQPPQYSYVVGDSCLTTQDESCISCLVKVFLLYPLPPNPFETRNLRPKRLHMGVRQCQPSSTYLNEERKGPLIFN
jgi:hypothetical protein